MVLEFKEIQKSLSSINPLRFDYVEDKPIKPDIDSEFINSQMYDKYHGVGFCRWAIQRTVEIAREIEHGKRSDSVFK